MCFRLGNWLRARLDNVNYHGDETDDDRYKLRLMSIQFDFTNFDKTSVTYSNVERNTSALVSDIRETLETAKSIASSYDYVASQAEQGETAGKRIDNILKNGYDSSLAAINAGENQDITMDRHGLLFRHYLPETDNYSDYQIKMINRNIVMTKDNWKNASLAIGLGRLPDGTEGYGVWADNIIGSLFAGNQLKIYGGQGEDGKEEPKVVIDENGITLDGGAIRWTKKPPLNSVETYYMTTDTNIPPSKDNAAWKESISDMTDGKYLWCKTCLSNAEDTEDNRTTIVCLGGSDNIKKTWLEYAFSDGTDSEHEPNEISWSCTQPSYSENVKNKYIWTRTAIEYMSGKITYTDASYNASVTNAILSYSKFKDDVQNTLGISGTTITKNSVISPKIGGGYLYITNGDYSVEIDPKHTAGDDKTKEGYLFCIRNTSGISKNDVIMGVDTKGNGYFSGTVKTNEGNIGGWNISETKLETMNNSSIYQYSSDIDNSPAMRIMEGKAVFGSYHNGEFSDKTYADVSRDGIYIGVDGHGTDYLFAAKTENNEISFGSFSSAKFYNTPHFYGGFRMYSGTHDYVELSTTALDSSAPNAYLRVHNSMAVKNRLQVGAPIDSFWKQYTFYLSGDSYVTGTSYTNNGTVVTSDRNKKNSIVSPADDYVSLFDNINFRKFKYNDGTSDRYHLGVIAQEIEEAMDKTGISSQDFAGLVIDENGDYFVRYDEINILTALKVKQLENKIKQLEENLNNLTSE